MPSGDITIQAARTLKVDQIGPSTTGNSVSFGSNSIGTQFTVFSAPDELTIYPASRHKCNSKVLRIKYEIR